MKYLLSLAASSVALLSSGAGAFAPQPLHHTVAVSTPAAPLYSSMPIKHNDGDDMADPLSPAVEMLPALAVKMVGILALKTVKDVVNYPPMILDQMLRHQSAAHQGESDSLGQTNPAAMLAKLMGILVFKLAHDAVYFPMLWTQRLVSCQSLDECEIR